MNYEYKYLAWWSAGITSAVACKLAIDSGEQTKIIYLETGSHHKDNLRFKADCEKWYGQEIEVWNNKKYDNHIDVILVDRFINGPGGAKCTTELKKVVRQTIERFYYYKHQVFGFEYSANEIKRAKRFKQQFPLSKPVFPLIKMHINKNNAAAIILDAGIELPEMYHMGYGHNNCIGCVKGGKGYWNKIRVDFPEVFEEMRDAEIEIGRSCINGTFLKDLHPNDGKGENIIIPECGSFCENKFIE